MLHTATNQPRRSNEHAALAGAGSQGAERRHGGGKRTSLLQLRRRLTTAASRANQQFILDLRF